jgi:hypothetical protein
VGPLHEGSTASNYEFLMFNARLLMSVFSLSMNFIHHGGRRDDA